MQHGHAAAQPAARHPLFRGRPTPVPGDPLRALPLITSLHPSGRRPRARGLDRACVRARRRPVGGASPSTIRHSRSRGSIRGVGYAGRRCRGGADGAVHGDGARPPGPRGHRRGPRSRAAARRLVVPPRGDAVPPSARLPRAGGGSAAGRAAGGVERPARRGRAADRGPERLGRARAGDGHPVPPADLRTSPAGGGGARAGGGSARRARRRRVHRPRPGNGGPRRRRTARRGPGRGRIRPGRPAGPRSPRAGTGRGLRHRVRLAPVPPEPRRAARADELPARAGRPLPRLPGHRVPARRRDLLRDDRPLQPRRCARRPAIDRGVRSGGARDPRPGRLDGPGPRPSPHPGLARRPAAQHVPGPARRRRDRRPARADLRGRQRVHHEPRGRTRYHHLAAAGPRTASARRGTPPRRRRRHPGLRPVVHRQHRALVRRPRRMGRRSGPPMGRRRRRPQPAAAVGPDRRRHRDRSLAVPPRRPLPRHARAAGQPRRRAGPRPRDLRRRLAPTRPRRPHPRRARRAGHRARAVPVGTDTGAPSQAAGSTLPRWSHSVRPSRNRTPSAQRTSTAPPANCSV